MVPRKTKSRDVEQRRQAAQRARRQRQPLRELFSVVGAQGGADPRDVERLVLRAGLTEEEVTAWRGKVDQAVQRIVKVHRSGNQGEARQLADRLSEELGDQLAPVVDEDPHRGVDDPRELAGLIRSRQQLGV